MKQSRVVSLSNITVFIRHISQAYSHDKVSVYAAQASYFLVISAMPLFTLITTVLQYIHPEQLTVFYAALHDILPDFLTQALHRAFSDITESNTIPILSVSGILLLWSASRGIGAVRDGVQTVFKTSRPGGYVYRKLLSLLYTLCFILLILAIVILLLFGEYLLQLIDSLTAKFPQLIDTLREYSVPLFFIFLTVVFTFLYCTAARRSSTVSHRIIHHIPGAISASLGWMLFSQMYSLYLTKTDTASFLYGGLTGLCLTMLWLYACMLILLSGAEINKLFFAVTSE